MSMLAVGVIWTITTTLGIMSMKKHVSKDKFEVIQGKKGPVFRERMPEKKEKDKKIEKADLPDIDI